mgnify:CR=1 FL=1
MKIAKTPSLLIIIAIAISQFYSCSIGDFFSKKEKADIDLSKVDIQDIQEFSRAIEQLQYYGFISTSDSSSEKYNWEKTKDIFNYDLNSNESKTTFTLLIKCLEYAKTQDTKEIKNAIEQGEFEKLLPKEYFTKYNEQINQLNSGNTKNTLTGIHFNILYLLNFMQPVLQDLLENDELNIEAVTNAYIQARKEDVLGGIMRPLFTNVKNEDLLKPVLKDLNIKTQVIQLLKKVDETGAFKFPSNSKSKNDSIEYIKYYYTHLNDYYIAKKELNNLLRKSALNISEFNSNYLKQRNLAGLKIRNGFDDLIERKRFEQSAITTIDSDYVDILPKNSDGSFKVRLRFKSGAFKRLAIDKDISHTQAEVFLVYSIHKGENSEFTHSGSLNTLTGNVQDVYTEISTGLTIQELTIKKTDTEENTSTKVEFRYGSKNVFCKLSLPEVGIWSRFKYDANKLREANEVLNCSKLLGIELNEIKFDKENWEPQLVFTWQPMGLFNEIKNSISDFQELSVSFSELKISDNTNFRQSLKKVLVSKVCRNLEKSINDKSNSVNRYFNCEKINYLKVSPISESNDILRGQISLSKINVPLIDVVEEEFVLDFEINYVNGNSVVNFQNLNLNSYSNKIRELIKSHANEILVDKSFGLQLEEAEKIKKIIGDYLSISSLYFDFSSRSLVLNFKGNTFKINNESQLVEFANAVVSDYQKNLTTKKELLKAAEKVGKKIFAATVNSIVQMPNCDDLLKQSVTFWGITFKITEVSNCEIDHANFKASINTILIEGVYDKGKFELTKFDASQIIRELSNSVISKLDYGSNIYVADCRVVNNEIVIPVFLKIASLNFDQMITEVHVQSTGKINISKESIFNSISAILTKYLKENSNLIPLGEYAGLSVEFNSVDIWNREILLNARAEFDMGIVIKCLLKINFQTGKISCDILENPIGKIVSILSNGLLKNLLSGENGGIELDEITSENIKRMQISGTVSLAIFGTIPLPSARFTLSKTGFDLDVRPKFIVPIVVPIAPPFASLLFPSVELIIDKKTVRFAGAFAPGVEPADVKAFSLLIKVASQLNIYYGENLGKADYDGSLILVSCIPLTKGPGQISIPDKYASMENSTTGVLDKVIKFRTKTELGLNDLFFAKSTGSIDILSIINAQLALAATLDLHNKVMIHVDGHGNISIPIGSLEGNIGSTLSTNVTQMMNELAYAEMKGGLHVGSFDLGGVEAKANMHNAMLRFHVGPLKLGATLPTLDGFTSDYVIRMILSVLGSIKDLPEALLNFFKHPNIQLFTPFGSGDGDFIDVTNHNKEGSERLENAGINTGGANGGADKKGGLGEDEKGKGEGEKEGDSDGKKKGNSEKDGSMKGEKNGDKTGTDENGKEKIAEESPYNCNCGDSKVGFHFAKYSEILNNIDKTFVATRTANDKTELIPFKKQNDILKLCGNIDYQNILFLVYSNNSDEEKPHKHPPYYQFNESKVDIDKRPRCEYGNSLLLKGESVIYGYTKSQNIANHFSDFNFFPIISQRINQTDDRYSLKFNFQNEVDGGIKFGSIDNSTVSFISTDGTPPYYNFVLAYNDNDVYLLSNTFVNTFNSYCSPSCSKASLSYKELYSDHSYFNMPGVSNSKVKIKYCFYKKDGGWFKSDDLIEQNSLEEISNLKSSTEVKSLTKGMNKNDRLWFYEDENNKLNSIVKPKDFSILVESNTGAQTIDKFNDYINLTSNIEAKLDKEIVVSLLYDCNENNSSTDVKSKIDNVRKSGVSESNMIRLIRYFNKVVNHETIDLSDLCGNIYLKDLGIYVFPTVENINGEWSAIFYTKKNNSSSFKVPLYENDITRFLGLTTKTDFVKADFEQSLFTSFFKYLYTHPSEEERQKLALINMKPDRLTWLKREKEESNDFSLVTLSADGFALIDRASQLFILNSNLINNVQSGSFYSRSDILYKIPILNSIIPELIQDTSAKVIIDYLYPDKPNSPLIIYRENSVTISLLIQNSEWLSVSKDIFFKNLEATSKNISIKNAKANTPRISNSKLQTDMFARANFIFSGLRGLNNWNSTSESQINPLSLFNKQGIKAK